jgi:hypothetical protein
VERPESVEEGFMNHLEAQSHTNGCTQPAEVRPSGKVVSISWKDHCKGGNLGDNVGEKIPELPVSAEAKHSRRDSRLQNGMGNPENVIKNLDFVAHRNSSPDAERMAGKKQAVLNWTNKVTKRS